MKKLAILALLVLAVLIVGCRRGGEETPAELDPFGDPIPPTPTLEPVGDGEFDFPLFGEEPAPTPEGLIPVAPQPGEPSAARFTNLRFAATSTGPEQSQFPAGIQEVYAIWDYDGMTPNDAMERVWNRNGELDVERRENWDFLKYGFSGTVRDVVRYDRITGLPSGQWRVEIYLNGELQVSGEFTIGTP
jgi:hypothetical protein